MSDRIKLLHHAVGIIRMCITAKTAEREIEEINHLSRDPYFHSSLFPLTISDCLRFPCDFVHEIRWYIPHWDGRERWKNCLITVLMLTESYKLFVLSLSDPWPWLWIADLFLYACFIWCPGEKSPLSRSPAALWLLCEWCSLGCCIIFTLTLFRLHSWLCGQTQQEGYGLLSICSWKSCVIHEAVSCQSIAWHDAICVMFKDSAEVWQWLPLFLIHKQNSMQSHTMSCRAINCP